MELRELIRMKKMYTEQRDRLEEKSLSKGTVFFTMKLYSLLTRSSYVRQDFSSIVSI